MGQHRSVHPLAPARGGLGGRRLLPSAARARLPTDAERRPSTQALFLDLRSRQAGPWRLACLAALSRQAEATRAAPETRRIEGVSGSLLGARARVSSWQPLAWVQGPENSQSPPRPAGSQ